MESPVMSPARKEPDTSTYSGRVGKKIRELREAKNLTLKDVVERLNALDVEIKLAAYSHWELGQRQIDWDAIPAIAECLGVSIRKLLPEE